MLSLVHLIYMAGDKCMRQNACLLIGIDVVTALCHQLLAFPKAQILLCLFLKCK